MSGDSGVKLKPSGMRATMAHRRMPSSFEHKVQYTTAVVKTTEFKTRLNLPFSAISFIGEEDCMLKLYVGVDKMVGKMLLSLWNSIKEIPSSFEVVCATGAGFTLPRSCMMPSSK
ncbi:hypothetical protein C2S52_019669 [Perilla frutescens var. hirtella]|nr:hypothetical protein C2S52_019669 [Perilla frutescens var. hirtella]